jgi:L-iditol 2-dehydrogenase
MLAQKFVLPMNNEMPGIVNYGPEPNSVEVREIPVPEIGDEEVLLAVQAVGICGSDIHQALGQQSWKVNYPVVLGHEFAGIIGRNPVKESL